MATFLNRYWSCVRFQKNLAGSEFGVRHLFKLIWTNLEIGIGSLKLYTAISSWICSLGNTVAYFRMMMLCRKSWVYSTGIVWSHTLRTETFSQYGHLVNTGKNSWVNCAWWALQHPPPPTPNPLMWRHLYEICVLNSCGSTCINSIEACWNCESLVNLPLNAFQFPASTQTQDVLITYFEIHRHSCSSRRFLSRTPDQTKLFKRKGVQYQIGKLGLWSERSKLEDSDNFMVISIPLDY